jgi:hypothetical protein
MKFTVNLNADDYKAFRNACRKRSPHSPWLILIVIAALEFMTWHGHNSGTSLSHKIVDAFIVPIIFALLFGLLVLIKWVIAKLTRTSFQPPLGPHEYEITDSLLRERNEYGMIATNRNRIQDVAQTNNHIIVILANGIGHIIPKRELAPAVLDEILNQLIKKAPPAPEWHR